MKIKVLKSFVSVMDGITSYQQNTIYDVKDSTGEYLVEQNVAISLEEKQDKEEDTPTKKQPSKQTKKDKKVK